MRFLIVAILAAQIQAQTTPTTTTTTPADPAADPPLIKTVADDPNDSPMVRAAKRAVRARQNPAQRRVVSLTKSDTQTRGRVAFSTGTAEGPKVPPPPSDAKPVTPPKVMTAAEAAAKHQAEVQEKLRQLQAEEERIRPELDEQYGHEMDEDEVDKRLAEIEAERKKLQESVNRPPM